MKRNFILVLVLIFGLFLSYNSIRRILTFRETAKTVKSAEAKLEKLKQENEALKKELELKSSDEFAEAEIRNKLGLAKEDETVLILPKEETNQSFDSTQDKQSTRPNWVKWRKLFFGS